MAETAIEWADTVWNATTGCDKVSPGCGLPRPGSDDEETGLTGGCYALTMAKRLKGMGQAKYQRDGDPRTSGPGFGLTIHPDALDLPLTWRKPKRIFVNSMSDLFHDQVPADFIAQVWTVMAATPQHTYLILTKRHARMRSVVRRIAWRSPTTEERQLGIRGSQAYVQTNEDLNRHLGEPRVLPNVWLGVSAENQQFADIRIPALLDTPAAVRWVSAEPLLGPIDLWGPLVNGHRPRLTYWLDGRPQTGPEYTTDTGLTMRGFETGPRLDWVVGGGESGPGARPAHPAWFRSLRDQCQASGTAYFHKQNGVFTWTLGGPYREPDLYVCAETGQALPESDVPDTGSWRGVWRVGKKAAGRELDGRTWDEFPQPAEVAL
jgi:protein gp37